MNHVQRSPGKKGALSLIRSFAAWAHLGSNWIKQASGGPRLTWALICWPLFPVNGTLLLSLSPAFSLTVCQPKAYVPFKTSLTTNLSCCLLRESTLKIEWGWFFFVLFVLSSCVTKTMALRLHGGERGYVSRERFNDDSCWSFLVCLSKPVYSLFFVTQFRSFFFLREF